MRRNRGRLAHGALRLSATLGLIGLVVIVAAAVWRDAAAPKARVGAPAPDFALRALKGGDPVSLSHLRGHVVVVNFFASWCGPCRDEAPVLRRLSERYRARGVIVVGLAANDTAGDALSFARRYGLAYPLALADEDVLTAYRVRGLPETVFIDAAGAVAGPPIAGPLTDGLANRRVVQSMQDAS